MSRFQGIRAFSGDQYLGIVESVTLYDSSGYALCIIRKFDIHMECWVKVSEMQVWF